MKDFYQGLKEVWGPQKKGPVYLKSSDGKEVFSDSKKVLAGEIDRTFPEATQCTW